MDYLLADLFRCAADFHGYFQTISYPNSADPSGILELISRYAQKVASSTVKRKFVERQAWMLLGVLNKPILSKKKKPSIQQVLHAILAGNPYAFQQQRIALFEIASQITGSTDSYASLLIEHIELSNADFLKTIMPFAKRGGPFWLSIWKIINKREDLQPVKEALIWAAPVNSGKRSSAVQRLSLVIASEKNGFEHEAELLKLALGLIILVQNKPDSLSASPSSITVSKGQEKTWNDIWHPDVKKIECGLIVHPLRDPRFDIPQWIEIVDENPVNDRTIIYWVGSMLRAAVLGGIDFTGNRWKKGKSITYKGLRTSWYKRRMGMMHAPEAVIGEYATVTNWFSELLMVSLQWPGFQSTYVSNEDIKNIDDLNSFVKCVGERLKKLNEIYCSASNLPLLPTSIGRPKNEKNLFRLVTVQQLLPRTKDFSVSDPCLNNGAIRAKHREHLMAMIPSANIGHLRN